MPELAQKPSAQAIRLVVCEQQPEDAEWLVAALRNAGIPSRSHAGKSLDDVQQSLSSQPVDLVVWGEGLEAFGLDPLVALCQKHQVPVLAAVNTLDAASFSRLKRLGVADVYVRGDHELARKTIQDWFVRSEEHRWAMKARQEQESVAKSSDALLEAVGDPVAYLNEGLHIKANGPYLEMLGLDSFEELEGLSLLDFVAKGSAALVKEKIKALGRGQGEPEEVAVELNGVGQVTLTLSPSHFEGEPCLLVSVRRPAAVLPAVLLGSTEAGIASEVAPPAIEEWLKKDVATGLFSRQHFLDRLGTLVTGSAWMIQADHQEQLLSSLGATQLDAFVKALGKAIESASPATAIVSRWTAGTLAVLVDLEDEPAQKWARSLQETLAGNLLEVGARTLSVSIGMAGVALVETMHVDEKVKALEALLKESLKHTQGFQYLDPRAEEKAKAKQIEGRVLAVKEAITENRLVLFFQPIASLVESSHRYEVLVKLRGGENRLEEPAEFMPLAEKHGLACAIDNWVVKEALASVQRKQAKGEKIELVLKVSGASLKDTGFVGRVATELATHGVPASQVAVEVPLSAAATYAKEILALRQQTHAAGLGLVLSGVTADAAALRLVDVVSPSWVKLSKDITIGLGMSSDKQALLKTVLNHVHKHDIKVIAGFIQDAATMTVLFSSGVEALQGQFLGPPAPDMNFDFGQMGF